MANAVIYVIDDDDAARRSLECLLDSSELPVQSFNSFVAKANIEHYRRKLAQETDETKRQTLARLLAEEEAKLASLMDNPQKRRSHDA
jgi:hypothetical protein